MTRSRRAGQTNRPSMSNGATRTSPTASDASSWRSTSSPTARRVQAGPPIPNSATSSRSHRSTIARTPACATSARLRGRVVDEPGRHQAACLARRGHRRRGGTARARGRSSSSRHTAARPSPRPASPISSSAAAVADTDAPSPIPTIAPSGARRAGPRPRAGRPSAGSGPRARRSSARDGRRRGRSFAGARRPPGLSTAVAVDDPDLDDALRAGALEEPRDLRPRDAELLGDRVLRLTQLVVQPAGADELVEVAHCTDVHYRCACMPAPSSGAACRVSTACTPARDQLRRLGRLRPINVGSSAGRLCGRERRGQATRAKRLAAADAKAGIKAHERTTNRARVRRDYPR